MGYPSHQRWGQCGQEWHPSFLFTGMISFAPKRAKMSPCAQCSVMVNIVMCAMKHIQAKGLHNDAVHDLTIAPSNQLAQAHVVPIVPTKLAFKVAEINRNRRLLQGKFPLPRQDKGNSYLQRKKRFSLLLLTSSAGVPSGPPDRQGLGSLCRVRERSPGRLFLLRRHTPSAAFLPSALSC